MQKRVQVLCEDRHGSSMRSFSIDVEPLGVKAGGAGYVVTAIMPFINSFLLFHSPTPLNGKFTYMRERKDGIKAVSNLCNWNIVVVTQQSCRLYPINFDTMY